MTSTQFSMVLLIHTHARLHAHTLSIGSSCNAECSYHTHRERERNARCNATVSAKFIWQASTHMTVYAKDKETNNIGNEAAAVEHIAVSEKKTTTLECVAERKRHWVPLFICLCVMFSRNKNSAELKRVSLAPRYCSACCNKKTSITLDFPGTVVFDSVCFCFCSRFVFRCISPFLYWIKNAKKMAQVFVWNLF